MSCICEGGFHPHCPIHKEVELDLNREQLDGLLWVMKHRTPCRTTDEERVMRLLYNRLKVLKKKLNA